MITLLKLDSFNALAAAKIRPLMSAVDWPLVQSDVERGRAELFQAPGRTFAITRVDRDARQLVIVALTGQDARGLFAAAVAIARGNGLRSIRFHTGRRGLAKLLREFGPVETETVYTVQVDG